jgi:hypothetical protein
MRERQSERRDRDFRVPMLMVERAADSSCSEWGIGKAEAGEMRQIDSRMLTLSEREPRMTPKRREGRRDPVG